jgi:hypothetical protein
VKVHLTWNRKRRSDYQLILILLFVTNVTVSVISPDYPEEEPTVQHPLLYSTCSWSSFIHSYPHYRFVYNRSYYYSPKFLLVLPSSLFSGHFSAKIMHAVFNPPTTACKFVALEAFLFQYPATSLLAEKQPRYCLCTVVITWPISPNWTSNTTNLPPSFEEKVFYLKIIEIF